MWRSLNNSVHFNLLRFELLSTERETMDTYIMGRLLFSTGGPTDYKRRRRWHAADASPARWLADVVVAQCPMNCAGCLHTWLIDSRKQPMSAADIGVVWQ